MNTGARHGVGIKFCFTTSCVTLGKLIALSFPIHSCEVETTLSALKSMIEKYSFIAVIHLGLINVHLSQVEVSLIQHVFSECSALVLRIKMLEAKSFPFTSRSSWTRSEADKYIVGQYNMEE